LSDRGDECDGCDEVDCEAVVSRRDAPPVLEPTEHALDDVAAAMGFSVERIDAVACGATRNDGLYAPPLEPVTQVIGVVGLVGDQSPFGRERFQERLRHGDVGDIARRQRDCDKPATSIGHAMDFRRSAAARDADHLGRSRTYKRVAARAAA
jgi:hypothetical protein